MMTGTIKIKYPANVKYGESFEVEITVYNEDYNPASKDYFMVAVTHNRTFLKIWEGYINGSSSVTMKVRIKAIGTTRFQLYRYVDGRYVLDDEKTIVFEKEMDRGILPLLLLVGIGLMIYLLVRK